MIGSTEKGLLWMDKAPFIKGVALSVPYWVFRAVGGTLMWFSHFVFAYNFHRMIVPKKEIIIPQTPEEILNIVNAK